MANKTKGMLFYYNIMCLIRNAFRLNEVIGHRSLRSLVRLSGRGLRLLIGSLAQSARDIAYQQVYGHPFAKCKH
jgi:hypothetical protein